MGKRRSPQSIRSAYKGRLRASYGDFRSPRLHFVMAAADRQPFEGVLLDLARTYPVEDDTDLNCDVCFTYIVRADQPLVVKLSLVGPYAVILSFGSDGSGEGSLVVPAQPAGTTDEARVFSVLNSHGFILVPAEHLETLVPLALVKDRTEVTLYAALFEPEGEVPWPHEGARCVPATAPPRTVPQSRSGQRGGDKSGPTLRIACQQPAQPQGSSGTESAG